MNRAEFRPGAQPMKTTIATYLLSGGLALVAISARAAGPASELYLTVGQNRLVGIQGASVLFNVAQSPVNQSQSALAVNSTIRTLGQSSGQTGGEYSLSGTSTGTTYGFPSVLGSDAVFDGTTNASVNFLWDNVSGAAYQFSLGWSGGTVLFTLGTASGGYAGITYDPSNNSLWIAGFFGTVGTLISDYRLDGTLLSSFSIGHAGNGALALDPVDGTLWITNTNASTLTLEQYRRSSAGSFGGTETPLQTQAYAGLSPATYGGEFQYTGSVVPEPATWITMLGGLGLLGCVQRFRRARKA